MRFSIQSTLLFTLGASALANEVVKRDLIGNLAQQLIKDLQGLGSCAGCEGVLAVLKGIAGLSDPIFEAVVTEACTVSKVFEQDVCAGFSHLESPVLAQVVRDLEIGSRTSKTLCAAFFDFCPYPDALPYAGTIPPLPKRKISKKTKNVAAQPLQIVHISDLHVDRQYVVGANWNCTKPVCCRSYAPSDAPGVTDYPAGPFGTPKCDTPTSLEESLYQTVKHVAPNSDFMFFTGDLVEAAIWEVEEPEVVDNINDVYQRLKKNGFEKVYAVVGNHDVAPVNLFDLPSNGSAKSQWVYDTLAANWQDWIGADGAASTTHNSGSYSVLHPGTNLRIISWNTNFGYKLNFYLYANNGLNTARDPGGLFAWLTAQLLAAEAADETVYIIGHMPPAVDDALRDYSNHFNLITTRFDNIIKGMFWGHTHTDEFEITYTNPLSPTFDSAKIVSYVTPCITPRNSNPSFRVYTVDPNTYGILDYTHYYTNASLLPSINSNAVPNWQKLYSAKEAYGPLVSPVPGVNDELTPAFWSNVTNAFEKSESEFQKWFSRKRADSPGSVTCTGDCMSNEICMMRASREQDNCQPISTGFNKRNVAGLMKSNDDIEIDGDATSVMRQEMAVEHGRVECGSQMAEMFKRIMMS